MKQEDQLEETPITELQKEWEKANKSGSIYNYFNRMGVLLKLFKDHEEDEFKRLYRHGFIDGQHHKIMARPTISNDDARIKAEKYVKENYK